MIVLEFRGVCTRHDLDKFCIIKGHATPRQLERGYESIKRQMTEAGCDDFYTTHSIRHVMRGRKMPAKYNV